MKFLIVGLNKGKMITRFREEATKMGHKVDSCFSTELTIASSADIFKPTLRGKPLSNYDLVYLCTGIEANKRFEWYVASDYIVKNTETKIVNQVVVDPGLNYYPLQSWFYLKQFKANIPFPKTVTINSVKSFKFAAEEVGYPLIVKISETHQGKGLILASNENEASKFIKSKPNQTYLVRQFVPNDGDTRVFCVGYKAIGAMHRIAPENDFRSNISQGGRGEIFDLEKNPAIKELAEKVSKICGIEVAGVDIMIDKTDGEPYVLEVNVGPQFAGLEKYTGVNAAGEIIKYFESKVKSREN
jgi:RimK family alpha-L-glutamate ligase